MGIIIRKIEPRTRTLLYFRARTRFMKALSMLTPYFADVSINSQQLIREITTEWSRVREKIHSRSTSALPAFILALFPLPIFKL